MPNPLMTAGPAAPPAPDPDEERQAQIWQYMQQQPEDVLAQTIKSTDYGLPVIGALAANPKVTAKDVIKAATDAAASGAIDPSAAVNMVSQMPADPDKLRPWLKQMYQTSFAAAVEAKSAMYHLQAKQLAAAQSQQQPGAQSPMPPQQGVPPQ